MTKKHLWFQLIQCMINEKMKRILIKITCVCVVNHRLNTLYTISLKFHHVQSDSLSPVQMTCASRLCSPSINIRSIHQIGHFLKL